MGKDSIISFSEQSKYALADELLQMISNDGPWSDTVLFSQFFSSAKSDSEYAYRQEVIKVLQYQYELFTVDKHLVTLTIRGKEVAKMGIENYNRKIEEDIRKEEEEKKLIEAQKEKERRKKKINKIIIFFLTVLVSLSTIYYNMCSSRDQKVNNEVNKNIELKNK